MTQDSLPPAAMSRPFVTTHGRSLRRKLRISMVVIALIAATTTSWAEDKLSPSTKTLLLPTPPGSTSPSHAVALKNSNQSDMRLHTPEIVPWKRYSPHGFKVESAQCIGGVDLLEGAVTLASGGTCTLNISFTRGPGDNRPHAGMLQIKNDSGGAVFEATLQSDDDNCAAYIPTRASLIHYAGPLTPDQALVNGQNYALKFWLQTSSPPNAASMEQKIIENGPQFVGLVHVERYGDYFVVNFKYTGDNTDKLPDIANALIAAWEKLTCYRAISPGIGKLGITKTNVTVLLDRDKACYAWRGKELSSIAPYVQLFASSDMNALSHSISYDASMDPTADADCRCKNINSVTFTFLGKIFWVRLFAYPHEDHKDDITLSDPLAPKPEPSQGFKSLVQWLQTTTEAPGATDIQLQYTSSFKGQQKLGLYSNLQYLFYVGGQGDDGNHRFGSRWFGVSSLVARDNRGVQDPDSTINTLTFMTFVNAKERECNGEQSGSYGDILDCSKFQIRPEILELRTGTEYALDTGALNQINSVAARFPMAFGSMSTFTFSQIYGIEGGRNFITEGHLAGSYGIFRGVLGSDASYRFRPHPAWLFGSNPYTLTGIFRARLPAIAEEFSTLIQNKKTNTETYNQILDTRLRPYGRAELTIPLTRIVSTAVVYQYGDLPPAFLFFGHTISASIKISGPADSER